MQDPSLSIASRAPPCGYSSTVEKSTSRFGVIMAHIPRLDSPSLFYRNAGACLPLGLPKLSRFYSNWFGGFNEVHVVLSSSLYSRPCLREKFIIILIYEI